MILKILGILFCIEIAVVAFVGWLWRKRNNELEEYHGHSQ